MTNNRNKKLQQLNREQLNRRPFLSYYVIFLRGLAPNHHFSLSGASPIPPKRKYLSKPSNTIELLFICVYDLLPHDPVFHNQVFHDPMAAIILLQLFVMIFVRSFHT